MDSHKWIDPHYPGVTMEVWEDRWSFDQGRSTRNLPALVGREFLRLAARVAKLEAENAALKAHIGRDDKTLAVLDQLIPELVTTRSIRRSASDEEEASCGCRTDAPCCMAVSEDPECDNPLARCGVCGHAPACHNRGRQPGLKGDEEEEHHA